ncbi:hypothetical protein [Paenibacillus chitinolyticus]|uniref:hypothetical protein n=1 Tax=Paenibacillus chitinolyticus TaxID=79263 RepID=UPI003670EF9B
MAEKRYVLLDAQGEPDVIYSEKEYGPKGAELIEVELVEMDQEKIKRFTPVLKFDLEAKKMYYDYVEREPTQTERLEEMQVQQANIILALVDAGLM